MSNCSIDTVQDSVTVVNATRNACMQGSVATVRVTCAGTYGVVDVRKYFRENCCFFL